MAYTIPPLLHTIRREADMIAPQRSHASDGTIGDPAHAARTSDHNPDSRGIVHAIDLTHDAKRGFNARAEGEALRLRCKAGAERRVKYIVSYDDAKRHDVIASPTAQWAWRKQNKRAHATHLHISILSGPAIENSREQMLRPLLHSTKPREGFVPKAYGCAAPEGYYMVSTNGAVYAFGPPYFGGWYPLKLNAPISGIGPYVVDGQTRGYWLFAEDGGVLAFGEAPFKGAATGFVT